MPEHASPRWLKPLVDYAPIATFFIAYLGSGLMVATAALMVVTGAVLILSLAIERRLPVMPLVTAAVVAYSAD